MADKLHDALSWLQEKQHAYQSRSVTYKRGTDEVTLTALVGRTPFRTQYGVGRSQLIWSERDFVFVKADLILDSAAIIPAKGDRITDGDEVYELTSINGEPHYRDVDDGLQVRCHTKRIAS